ncbi:patatin-domain-containing protein [Punctularia strigosozonata HHB-11173 SS5]|uniref:patatin-domain-containing protein n=1 Tax=Punctularia strigosozonata (strain HHB-11173) TaxID=741275 RepID=UPI00044168AC|nr:patatin-domain-containing protein [Punctularia strigosozonata HHB-11173 SS5]EIN10649.1 patatin-domain-containing protein [Punctularia strigosozonata HHB-11173 SS5]
MDLSSDDSTFHKEVTANYVDEAHIQAFEDALRNDVYINDNDEIQSQPPNSPALSATTHRVRKVSALSDFAPINQRVSKRQEWLYILLRWPLLGFIFTLIAIEFGFYVLIRQLVNTKEWFTAWRGRKGQLRKQLRAARTYEEWKAAAAALDEYLEFDEWKAVDEDPYYDWRLVRKVRRSLRTLREKNDVRGVLGVLETSIRTNFAGVESARLYSETFYGTKNLVESYIDEQERALAYIRESKDLSNDEKRRFFKSANTNLGTSALCLSGGASFGYYHFGVVKAFLDADLLPRVITGTSAGGVVAAMVCTRTDDELRALLRPELAVKLTAFSEPFGVWAKRLWQTGARFDAIHWARQCSFFTRGSMTFKEAYMRTGRVLNISVVPADRHSPTKLLNYLTTPDTVIWSALLASAAVPGILNPVVIMQKLKDGRIVPWNWGSKFKDGSLRVDIPLQALNLYFNVTHPVVSQVNPHVHLFFFAPRGSAGKPVAHGKGKGWRGNYLLSAAEQWLKLELTKNFKVIRDLELLPQLLGQDWSSVFLQRFDGTVTIWPRARFTDFFRILSDPDPVNLKRMMAQGEAVTWPKLHMIENRYRLEKQIYLGRQAVRRSAQARDRATPESSTRVDQTPEMLSAEALSAIPMKEPPLSLDTDAEAELAKGAEHYYKSTRLLRKLAHTHSVAPFLPNGKQSVDEVRDPAPNGRNVTRRKAVAGLFSSPHSRENENGFGSAAAHKAANAPTPDPPPEGVTAPAPRPSTPPAGGTLLRRLRTTSFPSFSPFSSVKGKGKERATPVNGNRSPPEEQWNDDSSSEDDGTLEDVRRHVSAAEAAQHLAPGEEGDEGF